MQRGGHLVNQCLAVARQYFDVLHAAAAQPLYGLPGVILQRVGQQQAALIPPVAGAGHNGLGRGVKFLGIHYALAAQQSGRAHGPAAALNGGRKAEAGYVFKVLRRG